MISKATAIFFIIALHSISSLNYLVQPGADWTGTCTSGTQQSPRDLTAAVGQDNVEIYISPANWDSVSITSSVNYLWKFNVTPGADSRIKYKLKTKPTGATECQEATYTALEFHFHRTSQHTINGASSSIEMHIVHSRDAQYSQCSNMKAYSVLGILFQEDANASDNKFFEEIGIGKTPIAGQANFKDFVGDWFDSGVFNYSGSLTTPTCDEVVNWIVSQEVQSMSTAQRVHFDAMGDSATNGTPPRSNRDLVTNTNTLYSIPKGDVDVAGGGGGDRWKLIVGIVVSLLVIIIVVVVIVVICCIKKKKKQRIERDQGQNYASSAQYANRDKEVVM